MQTLSSTLPGTYPLTINFFPTTGPQQSTGSHHIRLIQDEIASFSEAQQNVSVTTLPSDIAGPYQVAIKGKPRKGPGDTVYTPAQPVMFAGGSHNVKLACLAIPPGSYTSAYGDWTLQDSFGTQTFKGPPVTISFNIPSQALLTKVENAIPTTLATSANAAKLVPGILEYAVEAGVSNTDALASILDQIAIESGFVPVAESISQAAANTNYANQDGNGNAASGDGFKYRGRGLIQVTHKGGYSRIGDALGYPPNYFVNSPDALLDPNVAIAAAVIGMENGVFTQSTNLGQFFNSTTADFYGARSIVNGTERADYLRQISSALAKVTAQC